MIQERIDQLCSCGQLLRSETDWLLHRAANPTHTPQAAQGEDACHTLKAPHSGCGVSQLGCP